MPYFAGLDVSLNMTSVCIIDAENDVVREWKVPTGPSELIEALSPLARDISRVGLEAGTFSELLYTALGEAGFRVVCVDARHMAQVLRAQRQNKTDRNDARGIAEMMRLGLFRAVHIKTRRSQRIRALLKVRKIVKSKLLAIEADLRGILKTFGARIGSVAPEIYEEKVCQAAAFDPVISAIVDPALTARRVLREQYNRLHGMVLRVAREDPVCRRLMTMPGVGPVIALTYRVVIDVPTRFLRSRTVGVYAGLTPRGFQSGEVDRSGRVSRMGDGMLRAALYDAAQVMMTRVTKLFPLRIWALHLAERRGHKKAAVALARKIAVILHQMWVNSEDFRREVPQGTGR
ncbi:IS110 family transposase [Labrys sp. KB_33_2]|uniref:IS110 family transposase n=1 Tax=Labrys sp. KB_33_2 TaxID=3237479 RepID=UPI003F8F6E3F